MDNMTYKEFEGVCALFDATPRECNEYHWQVRGKILVNYWPTTRKIYIDRDKRRLPGRYTPQVAIHLAVGLATAQDVIEAYKDELLNEF